jgi:hypothetical protein
MQDRPTASELVLAAKEHIEKQVLPALKDAKMKYQTLVAAHVLGVVAREIELGEKLAREELASLRALDHDGGAPPATLAEVAEEVRTRTLALCAAIRRGDEKARSSAALAHVRRVTVAKLAIASPGYKSLTPSG